MTHEVKLHVGYIGKTRAGERVEIVDYRNSASFPWVGNNEETYTDAGRLFTISRHDDDIIGPWHDAPDVGEWIGWNGGPCPVHPETVVDMISTYSHEYNQMAARISWLHGGAYRIITPYVEPKKAREFWVDLYDNKSYATHKEAIEDGSIDIIHVREVLDDD